MSTDDYMSWEPYRLAVLGRNCLIDPSPRALTWRKWFMEYNSKIIEDAAKMDYYPAPYSLTPPATDGE